jgi:hypothetical protein
MNNEIEKIIKAVFYGALIGVILGYLFPHKEYFYNGIQLQFENDSDYTIVKEYFNFKLGFISGSIMALLVYNKYFDKIKSTNASKTIINYFKNPRIIKESIVRIKYKLMSLLLLLVVLILLFNLKEIRKHFNEKPKSNNQINISNFENIAPQADSTSFEEDITPVTLDTTASIEYKKKESSLADRWNKIASKKEVEVDELTGYQSGITTSASQLAKAASGLEGNFSNVIKKSSKEQKNLKIE